MDDPQPLTCQDQARRVQEEVTKLLRMLADAEPQQHLSTAADIRGTCDRLLAAALVGGMTRAREDGWGLRRIAAASRYSHEQVRTLLAAKAPAAPGAAGAEGPGSVRRPGGAGTEGGRGGRSPRGAAPQAGEGPGPGRPA